MNSTLIPRIKLYLRTRRHKKALTKIQDGLLENPKLLLATQKKFEAQFGKDQSRNRRQWKNLVRVYGMETVCAKEGLTKEQVTYRCNESNRDRTARLLKSKK